ncbi:MAG: AAA family ATPase [Nanoarchaeota archaeon]|nr:AAA family ATPase [Nanoarchaeota archaeon]
MTDPIERIPSGIPRLDAVIEGGFEKNSAILLSGSGGTGKTIFALQFLMEGIKSNETGVYISFEESKEKFYRHMLSFGWDLEDFERKGLFVFIKYEPDKIAQIVRNRGKDIGESIKSLNAKRIVIDSLSAYTALFEKEADQRTMLVNLFGMIESWGCTTIVTAEEDQDPLKYRSSVMGFMADAIILLYVIIKDDKTMTRALQVSKMRGTKHLFGIFPFFIDQKGIDAYPDQVLFILKGGKHMKK